MECQSVVDEVVTALRPTAEVKGLTFEAAVFPVGLSVRADRRALSQILLNLTSNAIKFTERGRVSLRVGKRQEVDRSLTEFSVADTGVGIRADDQAKLFQAFAQVHASHRQRQEGTGLGLHISRKLAEIAGRPDHCTERVREGEHITLVLEERDG